MGRRGRRGVGRGRGVRVRRRGARGMAWREGGVMGKRGRRREGVAGGETVTARVMMIVGKRERGMRGCSEWGRRHQLLDDDEEEEGKGGATTGVGTMPPGIVQCTQVSQQRPGAVEAWKQKKENNSYFYFSSVTAPTLELRKRPRLIPVPSFLFLSFFCEPRRPEVKLSRKQMKKLKARPGKLAGTRLVFDDEGTPLMPLEALAREQQGGGGGGWQWG